jgi:type I restriction enzyme S subunit
VPFEVPESWVWVKIKDIGEVVTGNTPSKENKEFYGNDYPFYKPTDLEQGISTTKASDNLSALGYASARQLPAFSILVTCIGATIGKTGLIRNEGTCNQQINAMIPNNSIDCKFLYYSCISDCFQNQIKENASATTLPIINKSKFEQLLISLPPLEEQKCIVQKIKECFTLIDQIEENKLSLSQFIKQTKSKVLDLAIRGKLVSQNPNDEPITIKCTSHISHYPFEVPRGWIWCRLGELYNVMSAKRVLQAEWKKSGIPFYRAREIVKLSGFGFVDNELFISPKHYELLKKTYGVPKINDIMLSAVGTIGKTYIVKQDDLFYYKDASVLCLENKLDFNSKFIQYVLAADFLQQQMYDNSKGTTVDTITIEKAKSYLIPLPPLAEQHRIVSKIEDFFAQLDEIENAITK